MARPPKYRPQFAEQAKFLYEKGCIDTEVADFFGVTEPTIHNWAKKYPDFAEARGDGKHVSDDAVVKSLYDTALAGNVTAQIFWLKNRKPDKWRDKQEVDHSGNLQYSNMTEQEIDNRIASLQREIDNEE